MKRFVAVFATLAALTAAAYNLTVDSGPPSEHLREFSRYDVLASKTFVEADLVAGTAFAGPSGAGGFAFDATETSVATFDVRAYSQVCVVFEGNFANAVTLQVQLAYSLTATGTIANAFVTSATTATSGGNLVLCLGGGASLAPGAGGLEFNANRTMTPFRMPFFRIKMNRSGATGTITNGKLFVFGIK